MARHAPPSYLLRFFKWFCDPNLHPFIEGDLLELYQERYKKLGKRNADRSFAIDVLFLFRPGIIRSFQMGFHQHILAMLKHNLLISWRNFKKDKTTFSINLLGLSSGMACTLLIFLWVQDELQMDKFHEKDDRLYQVMQKILRSDGVSVGDWTPGPLAQALKEKIPEVEYVASVKKASGFYDGIVSYENLHFRASPIYAEADYFNIFSYPLLHGDKDQVLSDKSDVIISEGLALKLFASTSEAMGKTIEWNKKIDNTEDLGGIFQISGVFKDIPPNSTEKFNVIFAYSLFAEINPNINSWSNNQASTYLVVSEGSDVEIINEKITALVQSKRERKQAFFLKKYSSNYLYNKFENGVQAGGRIEYVRLFSLIAVMILLIACINFMNLSTARASIRTKEIGVKKALGASRRKLFFQFTTESLLLSFCALFISTCFVTLFLPHFNQITGKELSIPLNTRLVIAFVGLAFITGLISSLYPALYLSGFNPVKALKGKLSISFGELWMRNGLVAFQFAISVVLIFSVLVVYLQMSYVQTKNLGYDRSNILKIKKDGALEEKLESFLAEVKTLPEVVHTTNTDNLLVGSENFTWNFNWKGRNDETSFKLNVFATNYDFIETFGIQIKEGRSFSRAYGTERSKVIINEAAVKSFGMDAPVGETITFWHREMEIIGVAKDFQYQSLYSNVEPCIFWLFEENDNFGNLIYAKIKAGEERQAIDKIADIYEQFNPGYPFEFGFVDEEYQALYESETKMAILSKYFAGLAIIISCLGLFGLAMFSTQRRMKEISIRKILGANFMHVISLLGGNYAKIIFIALGIAFPFSYWMATHWLNNFAYKISIEWWFFGLAALATIFFASLSVGGQTLKAIWVNPVKGIRDE